ncbi:hypothetical protein CDL15_Pgr010625 [Punica granatum]|uniref:Uncharacterized protein n=1 Tax=Punica granatum TaxID=22663 RepID=A0A218VRU7_PUNGR|nr:hypothetical protein CDL15_Pgr010625 [Punica granatum]
MTHSVKSTTLVVKPWWKDHHHEPRQLDNYGLGYLLVDSDDDDDQAKVVFASDKGILMQEPRNRKRHPGTTQRKLTMRSWKRPASPQFLRSPASRDLENRYSVVVVHHSS